MRDTSDYDNAPPFERRDAAIVTRYAHRIERPIPMEGDQIGLHEVGLTAQERTDLLVALESLGYDVGSTQGRIELAVRCFIRASKIRNGRV
ncbi:MAG: hypothetical protein AAFR28_03640 [Pseudomonadota bacterium]